MELAATAHFEDVGGWTVGDTQRDVGEQLALQACLAWIKIRAFLTVSRSALEMFEQRARDGAASRVLE